MTLCDKDSMKKAIMFIIPSLSGETLELIVNRLIDDVGVQNIGDFLFVTEEDFDTLLKPIQIRKLAAWRQARYILNKIVILYLLQILEGNPTIECFPQVHALVPVSIQPGISIVPTSESSSVMLDNWVDVFKVPWKKLLAISLISAEITRKTGRKNLKIIAYQILRKYLISLEDKFENQRVGKGCSSVVKKLEARVENINRLQSPNPLKRNFASEICVMDEEPKKAKVKPKDSYGCIDWLPRLGENENEKGQDNHIGWLQDHHNLHSSSWNVYEIERLHSLTYVSQRANIVGLNKLKIVSLVAKWPFLFKANWFSHHFKTLTGVDIAFIFEENLKIKSTIIAKFLQHKKEIQQVMNEMSVAGQGHVLAPLGTAILDICQFFKESLNF
ncbi:uncharacterized protein LOC136081117 [Hydra vulgaris]|uniref:Uncharacterized protein LOC136081117 n=1 Tax=Hydra vulgaris TaxID=6087 RepID=A0ABM4BZ13_HYDVU